MMSYWCSYDLVYDLIVNPLSKKKKKKKKITKTLDMNEADSSTIYLLKNFFQ